jgi:hypothetical protein
MAMLSNELLKEKWRIQKKFAHEARYNMRQMMDHTDSFVRKMLKDDFSVLKFAKVRKKIRKAV